MEKINCKECGKELNKEASFCPNCGKEVKNAPEKVENNVKTNGLALAGMIIGICCLLIDPVGLVAIAGLVLSIVGLVQVKQKGQKGKGFAITGIILSSIEFVLKFIQLLLIFLG